MKEDVTSFLDSLTNEKECFKLLNDEVLDNELLIYETIEGKFAGIAGIRRRFLIPVAFIVVKSEFQGQHMGRSLMLRLHEVAKQRYSFILLTVDKDNKKAINLYSHIDYRLLGEIREGCYYMLHPLNYKGELFFTILKLNFPLLVIMRRLVYWMRQFGMGS